MIDVNVFAGYWPFRRLIESSFARILSDFLREQGILCALMSPMEAVFCDDPQVANIALHDELPIYRQEGYPELFADTFPAFVLNPMLRHWQQSLRACCDKFEFKARAFKLHPNYHSYHLSDRAARELLIACGQTGRPVIVQMRMQDTRSHHPLMQVPDVDINEVLEAAAATPQTQFVIGGIKWGEASGKANDINALPNVWLDISQCEVVDVLRRLIRLFGAKKLLFGTHAPFFYVKSALLKLEEARLTEEERALITERNARELFKLE